jgi:Fe-S cluster assembly protein SufD
LVFVDGCYAPDLSQVPSGRMIVESLAQTLKDHADLVEAHLGQHAGIGDSIFTALNTAFIQDGAFVHVPRNALVDEPIHLLFVSTARGAPTAAHPRVLVVLEEASAATVVEEYVAPRQGPTFANAVTEIVLRGGAALKHYRTVREAPAGFHIGTVEVHQEQDSAYTSLSTSFGAQIGRNDLRVRLMGTGATCTLNGLALTDGLEHVDNHTLIEHAVPHGTSRQLYKGIVDDKSRNVFNGKVIVRPGAQRTDAQQANRNLLLSGDALVDTKPQLEIFADDVRCTHGATVGQLDADVLFYVNSRGLDSDAARALLTYGFASEVLTDIPEKPIRVRLEEALVRKLRSGPDELPSEPWSDE